MMQHESYIPEKYYGMPTFWGFFVAHLEEIQKTARSSGWNENTTETYSKIVATKIVPNLKGHNHRSILDYSLEDYNKALSQIKAAGKNTAQDPYDSTTLERYAFLIRAVVTVAARYGLSEDFFSKKKSVNNSSVTSIEAQSQFIVPKSLTVKQDCDVAAYLKRHLKKSGQAVGLLLMYALGLRNAEACGVQFTHIKEMSEYPGHYYLQIVQTTEIDKSRTKLGGKTSNAARNIPIPNSLVKILFSLQDFRVSELATHNQNCTDYSQLFITCKDQDYSSNCSADDLTIAGRDMFISIGMRQEELCAIAKELSIATAEAEEAGISEDDILLLYEKEPTSYLLRRNFATHMFLLGLDDAETHYIIGHTMEDTNMNRHDYTDESLLMSIKQKLDKRPILNNIGEFPPIEMVAGESKTIVGENQHFRIPTKDVQRIHLSLTANEPEDCITVTTNVHNRHLKVKKVCGTGSLPLSAPGSPTFNVSKVYQDAFRSALIEQPVDFSEELFP